MSRNQPSANPARRSILNTFLNRQPDSPLLNPPQRPFTPDNAISSSSSHHGGSTSGEGGGWGASPEQPGPAQTVSYSPDKLHPSLPYLPAPNPGFARTDRADSNVSSRRSSFTSSIVGSERKSAIGGKGGDKPRPISLSVNYVPAKFTKLQSGTGGGSGSSGMRRRKLGGGRGAWGEGENRMGMVGMVDDDEGVEWKMARGGVRRKGKRGMRWNRFKSVLFGANTVLMLYGLATLVAAILVWLNVFQDADVIRVGNREELIVSTVAAALTTLTAVFGYSGIILNNRAFLAVYTLLLWIDLGFIAAPGYLTYKQRTFNLEGKLNQQWSRYLGTEGRLRIQDSLMCCGYYSPFIEATNSPLCYARSILPGCKAQYLRLERGVLQTWYAISFGIVGAHVIIIVAALLCSNHVTYRFGKGLTPKRYRLDLRSMGVIMDDYANQIAAQYGEDVAQDALSRSVSHVSATHPSDNLIDFAATPRRNSFAVPSMPDRSESRNGTIATTSTGYNSQIQPDPRASVRLVSPTNGQGRRSEDGEWYQDAQEEDLDRMEVSTGYGSAAGGSVPRDRANVGWAQ